MAKVALVFLFAFCIFQISSGASIVQTADKTNTEIKQETTTEFVWTEAMESLYQAVKAVVDEEAEIKKQKEASSVARIARAAEKGNAEIKQETTTEKFVWTDQTEALYQSILAVVNEQKEMDKRNKGVKTNTR